MPKRPGSPLEPPGSSKLTKYFTKRESQSATTATTKSTEPLPDAAIVGDPTAPESAEIETKNDPPIDLSQLLSLGGLTTPEEVDARFESIANALFNDYRLKIHRVPKDDSPKTKQSKDTYLQVMEMEFYLIMPGVHEDPFCHGSIEQEQSGIWYFHRSPQMSTNNSSFSSAGGDYATKTSSFASVGGAYRGGSRKGIDLSLGSGISSAIPHTRGGILLRSARDVHTQTIVSGPSLLVDSILKAAGADSIETLVSTHWGGDLSAFSSTSTSESSSDGPMSHKLSTLTMVPISDVRPAPTTIGSITGFTRKKVQKVLRSVRIGLDLGHYSTKPTLDDPRVTFVQRPYRFLIEPNLLKVNGRAQTFLGLLNQVTVHPLESTFAGPSTGSSAVAAVPTFPLSKQEEARVIELIGRLGGFTASTARNYLSYFQRGVVEKPSIKSFCGTPGKGVCQSPEQLLKLFGALSVFGK